MAVKSETKEVEYCDVCGRRSDVILHTCPICGKDACYTCSHQLYDVWHLYLCKNCVNDETINAYFMDAWRHWQKEGKIVFDSFVQRFKK